MHAAGVWRNVRQHAASLGMIEGVNEYLLSVLNPWSGIPAVIPDLDMTNSIPKSVTVSQNIVVPAGSDGSGLLLCAYDSLLQNGVFRLYGWDPATSTYSFVSLLNPDEDLSENFILSRFVSGGIGLKSATVTGSSFTVSGTVEAIAYQDLPSIVTAASLGQGITYETLMSYARNQADQQASMPIQEGLRVIAPPYGDYEYYPMETNALINPNPMYRSVAYPVTLAGGNGWTDNAVTIVGTTVWFDSNAAFTAGAQFLPPNLWGKTRIYGNVSLFNNHLALGDTEIDINIVATFQSASATWARVLTDETRTSKYQITANVGLVRVRTLAFECLLDDVRDLVRLRITVGSDVAGWVATSGVGADAAWVALENHNTPGSGHASPGSVIAFKSVGQGQTIVFNGVLNYEAVPNATLARNVSTSYVVKNPQDLKVAEAVFALGPRIGIKFVLSETEYDILRARDDITRLATRENAVLHAAGLLSGLHDAVKSMWGSLKPMLRDAAPVAGGIAAEALGIPAPLGVAAGRMAGKLFSAQAGVRHGDGSCLRASGRGVIPGPSSNGDFDPFREDYNPFLEDMPPPPPSRTGSDSDVPPPSPPHNPEDLPDYGSSSSSMDTGYGVAGRRMSEVLGMTIVEKDYLRQARITDMRAGIRSLAGGYSRATFAAVSDEGSVNLVEVYVSEFPLIDDRQVGYEYPFEYTRQEVSFGGDILPVYHTTNLDVDASHAVLRASLAASRASVYVTVDCQNQVVEGSLGMAVYAAMCNIPAGPVYSGILDRDGDEYRTPTLQPVGYAAAKYRASIERGRPFVTVFDEELAMQLPSMAIPKAIAACAVTLPGAPPKTGFFVDDLSQLALVSSFSLSLPTEIRYANAALASQEKVEGLSSGQKSLMEQIVSGEIGFNQVNQEWARVSNVTEAAWQNRIAAYKTSLRAGKPNEAPILKNLRILEQSQIAGKGKVAKPKGTAHLHKPAARGQITTAPTAKGRLTAEALAQMRSRFNK